MIITTFILIYNCLLSNSIFQNFVSAYFYGQGADDLYIKAECRNLSDTYDIEDCVFYDGGVTGNSKLSEYLLRGNPSVSVSSSGTTISTSSDGQKELILPVVFEEGVSLEYKWVTGSSWQRNGVMIFNEDFSKSLSFYYNYDYSSMYSSIDTVDKKLNINLQSGDIVKTSFENGLVKVYVNGVLYDTGNRANLIPKGIGFYTNRGRSQTVKDIKVKRL